MSTKIYSGYKLDSGVDPTQFRKTFAENCEAILEKTLFREFVESFISTWDSLTVFKEENVSEAPKMIFKEDRETLNHSHLFAYLESYKILMTQPQPLKNKNYASMHILQNDKRQETYLYFDGNDECEKVLEKMDGVSDYSYWDNSDKPDDVSEEEWADRKNAWDEVIPFYSHGSQINVIQPVSEVLDASTLNDKLHKYRNDLEVLLMPSNRSTAVALSAIVKSNQARQKAGEKIDLFAGAFDTTLIEKHREELEPQLKNIRFEDLLA